MRPSDLADLVKALAQDVRQFVGSALEPLMRRQDELQRRVDVLAEPVPGPPGEPGKDGAPGWTAFEVARAAGFEGSTQEWLASLRGAPGDRGKDGESVRLEDLAEVVAQAVDAAVDAIPKPKDGTSVTLDDVRPMIRELVLSAVESVTREAVKAIPEPEPGKPGKDGPTLDELRPVVEAAVAGAVGEAVGKAAPEAERRLALLAETLVRDAVAALPPAEPGKDGRDGQAPTPEELAGAIEAAVEPVVVRETELLAKLVRECVQAIPPAEPGEPGKAGHSPTPEELRPLLCELVDAAVADIPTPVDGQSVTVDDVRPMLAELVAEAVRALPAPKDGKDGETVPLDVVRTLIAAEVVKAVAALPAARDGEDGRDAAAIDPLPSIDVTRSYARGTFASHDGGLWLARSTTNGMDGWSPVVVGVKELAISAEGSRRITIRTLLSDGSASDTVLTLPALEYRGAWSAENAYEPGDIVSWDGSMWHCEAPTSERPSASPGAWVLCVKHGRDGRDGRTGTRGERGAEGRAGRDLPRPV